MTVTYQMSVEFEQLRQRLFNPENHSLEDIEVIEKELIKILQEPNLDRQTKDFIKFTRKQARKKYLLWKYPPAITHVSPKVAAILRNKYGESEENKGLLD